MWHPDLAAVSKIQSFVCVTNVAERCLGARRGLTSGWMQALAPGSILGHAVRRREDPRLITGAGRYVDDIHPNAAGSTIMADAFFDVIVNKQP